ncbi:hypothetical protein [Pseudonocardia lacus]|uniref:hypothetical protein n=1 Tax=Pseudonocardia lacus TaxID=2835865 RepID=UPI001BDD294D|nr:hypothetical protein [Pseudonocardia lacus]
MTAATRSPLVAGIDAGVGTSTLAAALHARDGGVLAGEADVVVCAATEESLRAAATVACPGSGPRPVLVVTGGPPAAPVPPAVRTRYCAVVELPRIDDWATAAADVLGVPTDRLSPPLRSYAEALQTLVSALLGGGLLAASGPPMVIRPRKAEPWRGAALHAVGLPDDLTAPARPRRPAAAPSRTPGRHRAEQPHHPAPPDENRSRPDSAERRQTRTTRPPRRLTDARSAPSRPVRAARDEDDEAIEARNIAADRRPAARGRAG